MWWTSGCGVVELSMTLAQARTCSHPGPCDSDVAALRGFPAIRRQLDVLHPSRVRAVLREYGAWEPDELLDHDTNLSRLVWIAAGDLAEDARA